MPPTVFISYSHSDARWKDRLVSQLGVLQHEGLLATWHDGLIQSGADWLPAIETAMAEARIAIFIVSAAFLNSEFIRRKEVPALMARREKEGLRLIPLIASPCLWRKVPWLAAIQAWPLHGKTLAELGGVRAVKVLADLAEEILSVETLSSSAEHLAEDPPVSPVRIGDEIDPLVPTELWEFEEPVVAFDVLPHNRGLVVCHPQEVRILASWGSPTREDRKLRLEGGEAISFALSADGTLFAVGDSFASVTVYKVRDGTKVKSLQRRASAKEVKRFRKLGLRTSSFEYGELTFSPDGRYLAACRRVAPRDQDRINYPHRIQPMDEPVDIYETDGEFKYRLPGYGSYPLACFTRDSQHIVVGLERNDVDNFAVYRIEDGKMEYSICLGEFVRCIVTHPDDKQVVVSLGGDDERAIRFLSTSSGREKKSFSYHAIPDDGRYPCTESVCVDSPGHYLVSAHNCGVLRLWDVRRHALVLTWLTNARGLWVNKLLFSGNADYLFASLRDFPANTINTLAMVRMADLLRRVGSSSAQAKASAGHSQLQDKYPLTSEIPNNADAHLDLARALEEEQKRSESVQVETRRSDDAMEKNNEIAELLELGSRAWLSVSIKTVFKSSALAAGYDIEVTNLGKTPAVEVEIWYQIDNFEGTEIPDNILPSTNQRREAGIVIGPSATHVITHRTDPEGRDFWTENAARKLATRFPLIFYCEVTYRDIFGKQRKTVACRQSAAKAAALGGQEWVSASKHNRLE